jgi:UDP-glucose 4-epimerase
MTVLVTGAAGFIGSHLCERLLADGNTVIGVDNLFSGKMSNLSECLSYGSFHCRLDSIEREGLLSNLKQEYPDLSAVFHLAAIASVDYSMSHEAETILINYDSTVAMLHEAEKLRMDAFIMAGSAAEYGDTVREGGVVEEDVKTAKQLSPYGLSKYLASRAVSSSAIGTSLRFFNVYGPRQTSAYGGVIPSFLTRFLQHKSVIIEGDGEQTRDFLYVSDAVAAYVAAYQRRLRGDYNVCSGSTHSVIDLVKVMTDVMEVGVAAEFVPARPGDIKHSQGDCGLFVAASSWKPKVPLSDGMRQTVQWLNSASKQKSWRVGYVP